MNQRTVMAIGASLLLAVTSILVWFIILEPPLFSYDSGTTVRFAVITDYGVDRANEFAVAEMVNSWNPEFIVTLGDNNALGPELQKWDRAIGQYYGTYLSSGDFYPCIGNHDYYGGVFQYTSYFDLPGNERYYDVVRGPVHLFCVNSVSDPDGVTSKSTQAKWLDAELSESTSPWDIVYFHYPPYTSGTVHGPKPRMRWGFEGADIVLSGHVHAYERLFVKGLTYITGLPGGQTPRNFFGYPARGSEIRYGGSYGAMLVTASDYQITFSTFTLSGDLVESYTITKEQNPPSPNPTPPTTQ